MIRLLVFYNKKMVRCCGITQDALSRSRLEGAVLSHVRAGTYPKYILHSHDSDFSSLPHQSHKEPRSLYTLPTYKLMLDKRRCSRGLHLAMQLHANGSAY
jgi:hypothetical protein